MLRASSIYITNVTMRTRKQRTTARMYLNVADDEGEFIVICTLIPNVNAKRHAARSKLAYLQRVARFPSRCVSVEAGRPSAPEP